LRAASRPGRRPCSRRTRSGHAAPLLVTLKGGQHEPLRDLEVAPAVLAPEVAKVLDGRVEIVVRGAAQAERRLKGLVMIVPEEHPCDDE
jgi:hypothetical protein